MGRGSVNQGEAPDILYPVRKGEWNEELRYSLRSLSNLPHGRVFIVGFRPSWVQGVITLPREQKASKYRNANENLVWAADHGELSDPFLLFNDDFYVMQPIERMPVLHMGLIAQVIERYQKLHHTGAYWRGMRATYALLRSLHVLDPLSYELHLPIAIDKRNLREAWAKGKHEEVLHIRSLYGNLAHIGGEETSDVKVYRGRTTDWEGWPFLSSNDDMHLTGMLPFLQARFPEPSPYESH